MKTCFCHSKFLYNSCCKKFHQGTLPENALQRMRSRYCAYALDLVNYIIHVTHKNNLSYKQDYLAWKKELKNFYKNTKFENLEILHFEEKERLAFVSFITTLKE